MTAFGNIKAEIDEVDKEISRNKEVTGAKINCFKSVGLWVRAWKGVSFKGLFIWTDGPLKILGVWFSTDLHLEKTWLEVQKRPRLQFVCGLEGDFP